jgi:carboxyl-terminal processing protease
MKICKIMLMAVWSLALSASLAAQPATEEANHDLDAKAAQLTLDDLRTFTDVFAQLRRNYIEEVDDKTLLQAAINGMLSDLDPHSAYLPAKEYEQLDESAEGHYIGIGVNVAVEDQRIVIKNVLVPSPADTAGLNPGDIITAIDDVPVKGRSLQEAIDDLAGKSGTPLNLSILTPEGDERDVELVREYVNLPTVSLKLLDHEFGYFKIAMFNRNSAPHLEQALKSLQNDGIGLRGLIIDLRDNPGGIMQQAVLMADGFLDEGLIVSTRGRNAVMQMEFTATEGQWLPDVPMIVLVDRGTASASEVVAGALQDHRRAVIVGERTFGKGSVQSVLPLRNGDGIKITTARYYTPAGRSIQAEGIVPDIMVEPAEQTDLNDERPREADLDRHLANTLATDDTVSESQMYTQDMAVVSEALEVLQEAGLLQGKIRMPNSAASSSQDAPVEETL